MKEIYNDGFVIMNKSEDNKISLTINFNRWSYVLSFFVALMDSDAISLMPISLQNKFRIIYEKIINLTLFTGDGDRKDENKSG